jgi:Pectate lyase superfamily protein
MAIIDTFFDQGGEIFNVKAFGAVGNGIAPDTTAFQDAILAASRKTGKASETATGARGGVVYVPQGIYRITSTLTLPGGVGIRGEGMRTAQIRFELAATEDGLVWDGLTGNYHDGGPFSVGAFMEDVDVATKNRDVAEQTARDLVVLDQWQSFAINRVRVRAASRYNLRLHNCIDVSAFHLSSQAAGTSCLFIHAESQETTTTTRWVSCYFQDTENGPAVDVEGIGHTFDGCVFESAGRKTAEEGYGARVRRGTAVFVGAYFEANTQFDLIVGTEATANGGAAQRTAVTVINPTLVYDSNKKLQGAGGVRFESGTATLVGGNYGTTPRPLVLSKAMDHVFVAARMYGNEPEVEGASIHDVPGTVLYEEKDTRKWVQTGAAGYRIGGGALVRRHLSNVVLWTPGTVHPNDTAETVVEVDGAKTGDTVVVAFDHGASLLHGGTGLGARISMIGSVGAADKVAVTLVNHRKANLMLGEGTLRVDVWQH